MALRQKDPRDAQVGKRVRFFRLKAGLSQEKVAHALGMSFQQIQKYENGINRIAPSRLLTMAKLFKIDVAEFFGDDGRGGNSNFDVASMGTRRRMRIVELLLQKDNDRIEEVIISMLETHNPLRRRSSAT